MPCRSAPVWGGGKDHEEATWRRFFNALDGFERNGRSVQFWWRDDDATEGCPALDRILGSGARFEVPLTIAVIPARANKTLHTICDYPQVTVAQHGFAHTNHAPAQHKKNEFDNARDAAAVASEIVDGRMRLAQLLGESVALFVPPWNRFADQWLPLLPAAGFNGISTFSPRCMMPKISGLARLNTHVDVIDWHHGRGFIGTQNVLDRILAALACIRDDEPLGLLTHHPIHEPAVDTFLATLFQRLHAYSEVQWVASTVIP